LENKTLEKILTLPDSVIEEFFDLFSIENSEYFEQNQSQLLFNLPFATLGRCKLNGLQTFKPKYICRLEEKMFKPETEGRVPVIISHSLIQLSFEQGTRQSIDWLRLIS